MNLGQRTNSDSMQSILVEEFKRRNKLGEYDWVIIHHYTDKKDGVQVEYELWRDTFYLDEYEQETPEFGRFLL